MSENEQRPSGIYCCDCGGEEMMMRSPGPGAADQMVRHECPPVTGSGMESAVEAAARALERQYGRSWNGKNESAARQAISAAKPHLEAELADTVARLEKVAEAARRLKAEAVVGDDMDDTAFYEAVGDVCAAVDALETEP